MNGWREGGVEGSNRGTENVHREKRKRRIKVDVASENVAREIIVLLT